MHQIAKNLYNVIYALDFSSVIAVETMSKSISMFIVQGYPLHIGVVPVLGSEKDDAREAMSKVVYYLMDNFGLTQLLKFLRQVSCLSQLHSIHF
jgi:hypothetical protein